MRRQQRDATVVHVLDHAFARLLRVVRAATTAARRRDEVFCVATVHDLAPLRDPGGLSPRQQARFRRNVECLRLADLLLAVSRHTAAEVVAELGIPRERVRVLPMGVDLDRFAAVLSSPPATGDDAATLPAWTRPLAGRRVVLSVGSTEARKNLPLLPAIFRALRRAPSPESPLALAFLRVGTPLPPGLRAEIGAALGPDTPVVELGLAPERDLLAAYGRADALIFPSRLEGFGLPVLEALAAGCPVVCSDASSLPEVGGEAALYFSPDDPAGAAAHLRRLFTDEAFRRERVALGRARAAGFGWETHYAVLTQIYRQCPSRPADFHVG